MSSLVISKTQRTGCKSCKIFLIFLRTVVIYQNQFVHFFTIVIVYQNLFSFLFWELCLWTLRTDVITVGVLSMFLKTAQHWYMPKDFEPMWTALCNELYKVLCYLQQVRFSGVAFKHLAVTHSWSCQKTNWVVGGVQIYFLSFPAKDGPHIWSTFVCIFTWL